MIKSYTRKRLIDSGVMPIDVKRVANPYDYPFEYKTTHVSVKVDSAKNCIPDYEYSRLMTFITNVYEVRPCSCHSTAGIIARFLKSIGVDVLVVDGFYQSIDTGFVYAHSFCKIGQLYFDPTVEFALEYNKTQEYDYYSEREFNAYEYYIMQLAMGYAYDAQIRSFHTTTLLYYPKERQKYGPTSDFILDNEGYIISKTKDEIEEFYSGLNMTCSINDSALYDYIASAS